MHGLITLDLDGTTAKEPEGIASEVSEFLATATKEGWQICFVTGRSFTSAYRTLHTLSFPYLLAVQNGALLLEMPTRRSLVRHYLERTILKQAETIAKEEMLDFIVYGGFEESDRNFWRPHLHSKSDRNFFAMRFKKNQESWVEVQSFEEIAQVSFPSIKWIVAATLGERLSKRVEEEMALNAPVIRDPFNGHYQVVQATHPLANKGQVVRTLRSQFKGPVIAAGDDYNDYGMLVEADFAIAIEGCPDPLQEVANMVVPSVEERGILHGLKEALHALR